jgi:Rieske 2Fe-2S family protein
MSADAKILDLMAQYRTGYSLPGPLYYDADIFELEMKAIFGTQWIFACNSCEVKEPGDYLTLNVGRNSIVVVRDDDDTVKAYYNTCRHRGSRICQEHKGTVGRLVCPYHQWTYDLDGKLLAAGQMPSDFDPKAWSLKPVHVADVSGLIYICLAEVPPDIDTFRGTVTPYIAPHQPARTKVAFEQVIIEKANWKLVIENNRECYHCAGSHPELLVSLIEAALPGDSRTTWFGALMERKAREWDALGLPHAPANGGIEFRCIRLPFNEGVVSMTMDGKLACKKLVGDLTEPDLGSVRMFHVPNNWNHFLSDHIIHFRVLPRGPMETEVRTTWLVHEDAILGWDYDPARLAEVWQITNAQDQVLAEQNFLGIQSDAYEPGPYSPSAEFMILDFNRWYMQTMDGHLPPGVARYRVAAE